MKFVLNRKIDDLLRVSEPLVRDLGRKAEKAAEEARALAPVDKGSYRDSITGTAGVEGGTARGRVGASDWKAGLIEFGTSKTPAFAPLRRGTEAAGLRFVEKGK